MDALPEIGRLYVVPVFWTKTIPSLFNEYSAIRSGNTTPHLREGTELFQHGLQLFKMDEVSGSWVLLHSGSPSA
jgi:hypothetical protein